MHPKLLEYYEKELSFLRSMGIEFAKRYPSVGHRLDLSRFDCADPYVERLLEGFAFLAARIHLKLDAEFPTFTQYLLNMIYPHYLSPIPSMTILHFVPDADGAITETGFTLPKSTRVFTESGLNSDVRCEFRTSRELKLWPIQFASVEYLTTGDAGYYEATSRITSKAGLRLRLKTETGISWKTLSLDELVFYIDGVKETVGRLYELLVAQTSQIVLQPVTKTKAPTWRKTLPASTLQPIGFSVDEALLPYPGPSFDGYRLLQEYSAFPERFLFFRLRSLNESVRRLTDADELEVVFLFKEKNDNLKGQLGIENIILNAVPAINLFPRRADRIHLNRVLHEHHLIVDKTHVQDYEVYSIQEVVGFDNNFQEKQSFKAFYDCQGNYKAANAYYTWRRIPQLPPLNHQIGRNYQSSEVYLSLVDSRAAPYASDLRQLGVSVMCTNGDAPLYTFRTQGRISFTLDISAPIKSVESLAGPSTPIPAAAEGERAWRLINHLSLNYLSLLDKDEQQGAAALRSLLRLYADTGSASLRKQIEEGILSVHSQAVVRRLPNSGPIAFGRGLSIKLQLQESAFDGLGAFLLATVLEKFFAQYASINSFTQTQLMTLERGDIMQWPIRMGTTPVL